MSIVEFFLLIMAPGLFAGVVLSRGKGRLRADASLCDAASVGDRRRLRKLLAEGVDPNSADEDGTTALMAAASAGQADAVRSLLEGGADPDIQDVSGMTALMNAVIANGELDLGETHPIFLEIVELLLDHDTDPELEDEDGVTAAEHARSYDADDLSELLEGYRARR
jgi:ankyrin repeat protein